MRPLGLRRVTESTRLVTGTSAAASAATGAVAAAAVLVTAEGAAVGAAATLGSTGGGAERPTLGAGGGAELWEGAAVLPGFRAVHGDLERRLEGGYRGVGDTDGHLFDARLWVRRYGRLLKSLGGQ